ncbi:MAG TPA: hypothetical protein PLU50_05965, partial [Pseudobdellovibrionaceae bacterium]|nr:hypothetical protein [Pseudobdellovibrionaceae bacterium]
MTTDKPSLQNTESQSKASASDGLKKSRQVGQEQRQDSSLYSRTLSAEVWTEEKLYFTGDEYFTELLLQIKHAKVSIDIE